MNIYIYGDDAFKSEVDSIINHSNLRLYLDEDSHIEEIDSVEAIKLLIEQEPENIYLIDNDKILNPNSLNSKISFLKPKGAIEQSFLEEHGVLDSKFDSIEDLIKDLKDKFQENSSEGKNTQEEELYEEDDEAYEEEEYTFNNSIDYGEIEGLAKDTDDFEEDIEENIQKDDIIEENEQSNQLQEYFMTENIDNIDNISEEAMLNALNNMDDIDISTLQSSSNTPAPSTAPMEEISLSGSNANANEIASLISQLLTNKTLEITIKVKS